MLKGVFRKFFFLQSVATIDFNKFVIHMVFN